MSENGFAVLLQSHAVTPAWLGAGKESKGRAGFSATAGVAPPRASGRARAHTLRQAEEVSEEREGDEREEGERLGLGVARSLFEA